MLKRVFFVRRELCQKRRTAMRRCCPPFRMELLKPRKKQTPRRKATTFKVRPRILLFRLNLLAPTEALSVDRCCINRFINSIISPQQPQFSGARFPFWSGFLTIFMSLQRRHWSWVKRRRNSYWRSLKRSERRSTEKISLQSSLRSKIRPPFIGRNYPM